MAVLYSSSSSKLTGNRSDSVLCPGTVGCLGEGKQLSGPAKDLLLLTVWMLWKLQTLLKYTG
jgi:hypothetical protein